MVRGSPREGVWCGREGQAQGASGRDVFNEKPTREEMAVATSTTEKHQLGSLAILHTTMGDITVINETWRGAGASGRARRSGQAGWKWSGRAGRSGRGTRTLAGTWAGDVSGRRGEANGHCPHPVCSP